MFSSAQGAISKCVRAALPPSPQKLSPATHPVILLQHCDCLHRFLSPLGSAGWNGFLLQLTACQAVLIHCPLHQQMYSESLGPELLVCAGM